ncbi:MAG: hypothetical protein KAI29_30545 [Cyclobacteriaceae bacterium]|nr:hypothetical protein [Cyclobacteriaceae bacterium]
MKKYFFEISTLSNCTLISKKLYCTVVNCLLEASFGILLTQDRIFKSVDYWEVKDFNNLADSGDTIFAITEFGKKIRALILPELSKRIVIM